MFRISYFAIVLASLVAVKSFGAPLSSLVDQQWYIQSIGLNKAWKIVDRTPDVPIAVIDMDFSFTNAEMSGVYDLALSRDFTGLNFLRISSWGVELQHGSMAAGLIAANGLDETGITGVVKQGRIIALNVPPEIGPINYHIDLTEVIRYAVDSGAKVINCSFGISQPSRDYLAHLREAIQYASERDVVIVASAGNSGTNNDVTAFYPANFSSEFDNVISVGASTSHDQVWEYSQYGEKTVDFFAPGDDMLVIARDSVYVRSEGTSEAAPIVTGVVALMRQVNPKLSAGDVKRILRDTSDKLPAFARKSVSGGRVNAAAAVSAASRAGSS